MVKFLEILKLPQNLNLNTKALKSLTPSKPPKKLPFPSQKAAQTPCCKWKFPKLGLKAKNFPKMTQ